MRDRWGRAWRRDPRQARFLTLASLRWVMRNRAYTPWYLVRYWRLLRFRLANPHVVLRGMVFLGKRVELHARPGYGRLEIGRWVHIGDGNSLRCHEGSLRIGDKVVFGKDNTVNCYLDVEIGAATIVADWVYVTDFDHRIEDVHVPIKDQGIVKTPVRIGPDCWLGMKVVGAARHAGRAGLGARCARRGPRRHPRVLDRGRRARAGGARPAGRLRGRHRPTARRARRHRAQDEPLSEQARSLRRGYKSNRCELRQVG